MEMLLREKPSRCMTEKVPTMDIGSASDGNDRGGKIAQKEEDHHDDQADRQHRVNLTSCIDSRIRVDRS